MSEIEAIRNALCRTHDMPNGPARNAAAEQLVDRAAQTGDTDLLIEALLTLILAYESSTERAKMFVPFAQALRLWDEQPTAFSPDQASRLHWVFKWVTSGMVGHAAIPLATIEHWLAEMRQRYLVAGYSLRPVYAAEHALARHIGDVDRAWKSHHAWLAADRDEMSDCQACESNGQGTWLAEQGDDAGALGAWRR